MLTKPDAHVHTFTISTWVHFIIISRYNNHLNLGVTFDRHPLDGGAIVCGKLGLRRQLVPRYFLLCGCLRLMRLAVQMQQQLLCRLRKYITEATPVNLRVEVLEIDLLAAAQCGHIVLGRLWLEFWRFLFIADQIRQDIDYIICVFDFTLNFNLTNDK